MRKNYRNDVVATELCILLQEHGWRNLREVETLLLSDGGYDYPSSVLRSPTVVNIVADQMERLLDYPHSVIETVLRSLFEDSALLRSDGYRHLAD
jgi:hypothetical protein